MRTFLPSLKGERRLLASFALVLALTAIAAAPALAITDGEPDGNGHPYVGMMVMQDEDGVPISFCTGTMLSATVFLTAGHCTHQMAHAEIFFDPDIFANYPANGWPSTGVVGGTPITHPDFDPNRFYYRDLGVVVLDDPYPMATYGVLPGMNELDALKPSRRTTFTSVGYGYQKSYPLAAFWKTAWSGVRMVAHPHLLGNVDNRGDFSLALSNNANTGGLCFGDSGGPTFLGDSNVVAGVGSYVFNYPCGGLGGIFRTDRGWSLDWLDTFLP